MALPLLPLLIGGGLLAGQSAVAKGEGGGFLDTLFSVDRSGQRRPQRETDLAQQRSDAIAAIDLNDPASLQRAAAITGDDTFLTKALELNKAQQDVTRTQKKNKLDNMRADTNTLASSYRRELGSFAEQQQNFQALTAALESGTAQDALTSTILVMKALDPTSVVRQEEGRAVVQAEGLMSGFANTMNKLLGRGWNATTRREWHAAMRRVYAPAANRAQRQISQFEAEAARRGVNPQALMGLGIDRELPGMSRQFNPTTRTDRAQQQVQQRIDEGFVLVGDTEDS